jgi:tetratricopeptide (TPR) repeat protein
MGAAPPGSRQAALATAALLVAVLGLYGRALGYPFVYDDRTLIAANAALGDWTTLPEALVHDLFHFSPTRASPFWRPVVTASYYLDHALGGGAPWAFHLTNLLALAGAAAGLLRLLAQRGAAVTASAAAALAFVAHPAQVEGAVNIAGRTDVLACAFALWALGARGPAGAFVLTLLACGAKEIGVLVPLAAWALGARTWRASAAAAALFLVARQAVLAGLDLDPADAPGPSPASALGAAARALWYLGRVLWPSHLAPAMDLAPIQGLAAWLGWGAVLALAAAALALRRGRPEVSAGLALAVPSLLAVSGLASASLRFGETFLVLPLAGCALAAAPSLRDRRAAGVALALAALGAAAGWGRVPDWTSERALWEGAHARLPGDARIGLNLARVVVQDDPERALALTGGEPFTDPRIERERAEIRARAYQVAGQGEAAVAALRRASADDPEATWANAQLCVALQRAPEPTAVTVCGWATRDAPDDAALWNALGLARAIGGGDPGGAVVAFSEAVRLAPQREDFAANLAIAREQAGEAGETGEAGDEAGEEGEETRQR